MDCEALIREVALYPPLWNKKSENYTNRIVTSKIWDGIAKSLKTTKEKCRKKWKYLKDEHRKALRKVPQRGSAEPHSSRFKYFDSMAFLKSDMNSHGEDDIEYPLGVFSIDDIDCSFTEEEQLCEIPMTNKQRRKKRIRTNEVDDAYLEIEKKKLKLLEKDVGKVEDCADVLFFKSLLPFVKGLPPLKKLKMRGEIQEVVRKYVEKEEMAIEEYLYN